MRGARIIGGVQHWSVRQRELRRRAPDCSQLRCVDDDRVPSPSCNFGYDRWLSGMMILSYIYEAFTAHYYLSVSLLLSLSLSLSISLSLYFSLSFYLSSLYFSLSHSLYVRNVLLDVNLELAYYCMCVFISPTKQFDKKTGILESSLITPIVFSARGLQAGSWIRLLFRRMKDSNSYVSVCWSWPSTSPAVYRC